MKEPNEGKKIWGRELLISIVTFRESLIIWQHHNYDAKTNKTNFVSLLVSI